MKDVKTEIRSVLLSLWAWSIHNPHASEEKVEERIAQAEEKLYDKIIIGEEK
jgi:hypothetical protein